MKTESYYGCADPDNPDKVAHKPRKVATFAQGIDPYHPQQTYSLQTPPRKLSIPAGRGWRYDLTGRKAGDNYVVIRVETARKKVPCTKEYRLLLTVHNAPDTADVIVNHITTPRPAATTDG